MSISHSLESLSPPSEGDPTAEVRRVMRRLRPGDRVLYASTGDSPTNPADVTGIDHSMTADGEKIRIDIEGPRGGQFHLLSEPAGDGPYYVYARGKHSDDPVRWRLKLVALAGGGTED